MNADVFMQRFPLIRPARRGERAQRRAPIVMHDEVGRQTAKHLIHLLSSLLMAFRFSLEMIAE